MRILPYLLLIIVFGSCGDLTSEEEQRLSDYNSELTLLNEQLETQLTQTQQFLGTINQKVTSLIPDHAAAGAESLNGLTYKLNTIGVEIANLRESLKEKQDDLKNSTSKNDRLLNEMNGLQSMLASKQQELSALEQLVTDLEADLRMSDNELYEAEMANEQLKEYNEFLAQEMDKRFMIVGDRKSLEVQQVIERKGLPLFRFTELKPELNPEAAWELISAKDVRIELHSSEAQLHTNHPESSYLFEQDGKNELVLLITDPNAFWSSSRVLVIETK